MIPAFLTVLITKNEEMAFPLLRAAASVSLRSKWSLHQTLPSPQAAAVAAETRFKQHSSGCSLTTTPIWSKGEPPTTFAAAHTAAPNRPPILRQGRSKSTRSPVSRPAGRGGRQAAASHDGKQREDRSKVYVCLILRKACGRQAKPSNDTQED